MFGFDFGGNVNPWVNNMDVDPDNPVTVDSDNPITVDPNPITVDPNPITVNPDTPAIVSLTDPWKTEDSDDSQPTNNKSASDKMDCIAKRVGKHSEGWEACHERIRRFMEVDKSLQLRVNARSERQYYIERGKESRRKIQTSLLKQLGDNAAARIMELEQALTNQGKELWDVIHSREAAYECQQNTMQQELEKLAGRGGSEGGGGGNGATEQELCRLREEIQCREVAHQEQLEKLRMELQNLRVQKGDELAVMSQQHARKAAAHRQRSSVPSILQVALGATSSSRPTRASTAYAMELDIPEMPLSNPERSEGGGSVDGHPNRQPYEHTAGTDGRKLSQDELVAIVAAALKQAGAPGSKPAVLRRSKAKVGAAFSESGEERRDQVAACREFFKAAFNIKQDDQFALHQTADPKKVDDFINSDGDGPEPEDLHFDMNGLYNNPWNLAVVSELVKQFEEARLEQPAHGRLPARPRGYVKDMFLKKFKRCKGYWTSARPKTSGTGVTETAKEVGDRILTRKIVAMKLQRHTTRRIGKYKRRAHIIQGKLDDLQGSSEIDVWIFLRDLVNMLGHDGMSSDESESEGGSVYEEYRVKTLPWRRNMDKELDIIDAVRGEASNHFGKQGSKPVKRLRQADAPASTRPPVQGLPKPIYDEAWLNQDRHRARQLGVSDDVFRWPKIVATHAKPMAEKPR